MRAGMMLHRAVTRVHCRVAGHQRVMLIKEMKATDSGSHLIGPRFDVTKRSYYCQRCGATL